MNDAKLARYVELSTQRKALESEANGLKDEERTLEAELLEEFSGAGVQSVKVNGITVYVQRQVWAGAVEGDRERACAALRMAGLAEMVQESFNTQTLSAWVREREKEGERLPEEFAGAINVSEVFNLRTRKS